MLGEFAKYAFFVLKRKRRDFERSVLKYVSIKIPALTHSGRKSRVCVNQPDRLCHAAKLLPVFLLPLPFYLLPFADRRCRMRPHPQGFFLPPPSDRLKT